MPRLALILPSLLSLVACDAQDSDPDRGGTGKADVTGSCEDFVAPCHSSEDCGDGFACFDDPSTCLPSSCSCDPATGNIGCTNDCGGSECRPIHECADFEAPCQVDDDCRTGEVCEADATTCSPSVCSCDPVTGNIACTQDCAGKECIAA